MRIDRKTLFGLQSRKSMGKFMCCESGSKSKPAHRNVSHKMERKGDLITMSEQAKALLRDEYIDKVLNSGEPLKGISLNEFRAYLTDKNGGVLPMEENLRREYRQALKGDNASIAQREWRTNPNYRIPPRIADNPVLVEERDAVLEKYVRGEELEEWEKRVWSSFSYVPGGDVIQKNAELDRMINMRVKNINAALSDNGITLGEDDEINFEIKPTGEMTVTGNIDEEKLGAISDALKDKSLSLYGIYKGFTIMRNVKGGSAVAHNNLILVEENLKGTGVTVFDISVNEKNEVVGLPEGEKEFVEKFANGSSHKEQIMREALRSAIRTVQNGRYDYYKPTARLTLKNGEIIC